MSCLFCRVAFLFCNFFQLWRIESENFGNLKGIKTDSGGNNDEKSIFTIRSGTGAGPAAAILAPQFWRFGVRAGAGGADRLCLGDTLTFARGCGQLYDGVLRLHILANSDSEEDQALKLKVRDRVLQTARELGLGDGCADIDSLQACLLYTSDAADE